MIQFEPIIATLCMIIVMIACALKLNEIEEDGGHCAKWGFAITGGGALGCALEWWLPRGSDWHMDTVLAVGMALISLSTMRKPARDWFAKHWHA